MKIIATISKLSYGADAVEEILRAGADVLRYHFSHGTPEEIEPRIRTARLVIERLSLRRKVKICVDVPNDASTRGRSGSLRSMSPEWVIFSAIESEEQLKKEKHALVHALGYCPTIIARIETQKGIEQSQEIARSSDTLLVEREALQNSAREEFLGIYQKTAAAAAHRAGKQVFISVQCIDNSVSTSVFRVADILDLTNAVHDGTDGIVFSEGCDAPYLRAAKRVIDAVRSSL